MGFSQYIRTDIASEQTAKGSENVKNEHFTENGFTVHKVTFDKDEGGFRAGCYYTFDVGAVWNLSRGNAYSAAETLSTFLSRLCEPYLKNGASVLTVCLGNRRITSDAIGPLCADKLVVTRHIKSNDPELFKVLGNRECSVLCTGVTGDTGIETFEIIRSAVNEVKPSLVICIDALASRSIDRLATTVQFSNVGISPGSGIGNNRKEISRASLGVPVVSIGVPTVVHSSTLVIEALEKAGISELPDSLRDVLENGKSYFVTLKDSDSAVKASSELIARAINKMLLGFTEL